jgi:hypothetical protein
VDSEQWTVDSEEFAWLRHGFLLLPIELGRSWGKWTSCARVALVARVEVVSGRVWEDGELGGDWGFWCLGCEFWGLFIKRLRIFSMGVI